MALREFWPFEALPNISGANLAASPLAFLRPDVGLTVSVGGTTCSVLQSDGTLQLSSSWQNSQVNAAALTIPYGNVSDFTTDKSFIGMRYRNTMGTTGQVSALMAAWLTNGAGTVQPLINLPLVTAAPYQYYEIMIDRTNKQIVTWLDNVQQAPVAFDFNGFVNGGACTLSLGVRFTVGTINSSFSSNFRDVYFVDDTQDATQCTRLGPVGTAPAPLASATAPNYVSSDSGTPLSDLSTILGTTAATQTLPTQTSPATLDPITLGVSNANINAAMPILGVKMDVSASRSGGSGFVLTGGAKFNGQTSTGKKVQFVTPNLMYYNQNALLAEKAPDGTNWTPASVAAAQFTLTPAAS